MIVVKVELWPGGKEDRKTSLGMAFIVNDRTGTRTHGNYTVMLGKIKDATQAYRIGRVVGWARRGSPWNLLMLAIAAAEMRPSRDAELRKAMQAVARRAMRGQVEMFEQEEDDGETFAIPDDG